jgi:hypothetical protein
MSKLMYSAGGRMAMGRGTILLPMRGVVILKVKMFLELTIGKNISLSCCLKHLVVRTFIWHSIINRPWEMGNGWG